MKIPVPISIVFAAMLFGPLCLVAQIEMTDSAGHQVSIQLPDSAKATGDTTVIKIGDMSIIITDKDSENVQVKIEGVGKGDSEEGKDDHRDNRKKLNNVSTRFGLFNIGINGYLNDGQSTMPAGYEALELNYGKSIHVDLHVFQQRVNLIKHYLNIVYGFTLDFNNYKFQNPYTLKPREAMVTPIDAIENWKKSKLATTFISIPIMLNIETNPYRKKQSLHISGGVFGGYLLGAHTKQKATDGTKLKEFDDFNVSKFRYGVIGQIGFSWFSIYAKYSMVPLFNEGEGPDLTPFSAGLVLLGF